MRVLILALLLSACVPKCLRQECKAVDSTCSQIVGWVPCGTNITCAPIYHYYPCKQSQCTCVEREVGEK